MDKAKFHKILEDNQKAFVAADLANLYYELINMITKEESKTSPQGRGANSTAANYAKSYQSLSELVNKNPRIESEIVVVCENLRKMLYSELEVLAFKRKNLKEIASKFIYKYSDRPQLRKAILGAYNDKIYYAYFDCCKMILSPKDYGYGINDTKEKSIYIFFAKWLNDLYEKEKDSVVIPITDEMIIDIFISIYINRGDYEIKKTTGETIRVNAEWLKNCIDFTKAAELKVSSESDPVIFHGIEDRHAILLPMKKD